VVAAVVLFMASILLDAGPAVGVVLEENSVSVRRTLFILVFELIAVIPSLVGRHESDLLFLVAREYVHVLLPEDKLVELIH